MKSLIFIFILIAFPAVAEVPCDLLHKADFKEVTQGLKELGRPLSFISASVRIQMVDTGTDKVYAACSGSFVSDDGTILTASHCLDQCRFKEDGSSKGVASCRLKLNGVLQDVQVLKASSCGYMMKRDYLYSLRNQEDVSMYPARCQGEDLDDYAVLKPADPAALGGFSCLPVGADEAPLDASVFTMGYPSKTSRADTVRDSLDAPGKTLVVSSGKVVDQKTCDQYWQGSGLMGMIFGREKQIVKTDLPANKGLGRVLQTTVDAVPGSSGGPLINSSGEVVGVFSHFYSNVHNFSQECTGATFFQPVTKWTQDLPVKPAACQHRRASQGEGL